MKQIKTIIKEILHWILSNKKGYTDLKVLFGQAKGSILRLDLRKEGSYFLGNYDQWIFERINFSDYVKPGMVVWDGGAYVGYYTAVFRKCIGSNGLIYTFEASTKAYNLLKELPVLNNWDNVEVVNLAIGSENSIIKFSDNLGGSNGPVEMSKKFNEKVDIIEVECRGVDELIALKNIKEPDFIKFDLETAEEFALHNGDKLFREKRPLLLLELHGENAFSAAGLFLEKYNYKAAYVGDFPKPENWYCNFQDLKKIGFIPHMIFCFPK